MLDAFDFTEQGGITKRDAMKLAECEFIDQKNNVVFLGPPGTGKAHLASALGYAACRRGKRVLFTTAADLLLGLTAAKREDKMKARLQMLDRIDLLIVDELGYIPFEQSATDLLYQVISRRYERGSFIITTNLDLSEWTQVFPSAVAASAVVNRIAHHAHIFSLSGESYRLAARRAGERSPVKAKVAALRGQGQSATRGSSGDNRFQSAFLDCCKTLKELEVTFVKVRQRPSVDQKHYKAYLSKLSYGEV